MQGSQDTIASLRQKFPNGAPNVRSLSDEQKAWLHMKIQSIAEEIVPSQVISQLEEIGNRLIHATEDIPDEIPIVQSKSNNGKYILNITRNGVALL